MELTAIRPVRRRVAIVAAIVLRGVGYAVPQECKGTDHTDAATRCCEPYSSVKYRMVDRPEKNRS
jgi:hypothetical protein